MDLTETTRRILQCLIRWTDPSPTLEELQATVSCTDAEVEDLVTADLLGVTEEKTYYLTTDGQAKAQELEGLFGRWPPKRKPNSQVIK